MLIDLCTGTGVASVAALKEGATALHHGLLLIAQMSTADTLTGESFVEAAKT